MVTHFHATLQETKKTFKKFIFQVLVNNFAPKNAEKFEVYENRSIFCRFRKLTKLLRKQWVTIVVSGAWAGWKAAAGANASMVNEVAIVVSVHSQDFSVALLEY